MEDYSSYDIDVDSLNLTSEVINFDEIDDDLERYPINSNQIAWCIYVTCRFQEDEMVQQALHRGVDLKKYGRDLEKELREVYIYV